MSSLAPSPRRSSSITPRPLSRCTGSSSAPAAEVIQAFAFYASREKLANVGYGEKVLDLNRQAVKIAREVAGDDVLVAGNLSTTWSLQAG